MYGMYGKNGRGVSPENTGHIGHTPAPPFRITTILPPEVPSPLDECTSISTNDAALWSLDAIYMQEVIPKDE